MSGHSKWSTIKRQKGANDAARGKLFSKLSRAISIATKIGGSNNPETNYSLRIAIEAAKAENMPKDTIERAISKASETSQLEEVVYEGFANNGIQLMLLAATDNRNRTSQIIKSLLDKAGGAMGGPGSVSFNFDRKGLITIKKTDNLDEQILKLIDLGVEDIQEGQFELLAYVDASELFKLKDILQDSSFVIQSTELVQLPKTTVSLSDQSEVARLIKLLDELDEEEDIQKIFTNVEFDE